MLKKIIDFFKSTPKSFLCGGIVTKTLLSGNNEKSYITYNIPTESQKNTFAIKFQLGLNEQDLSEYGKSSSELKTEDLIELLDDTLYWPAFKKIVISIKGYTNADGEQIDNVELLKKYHMSHIRAIVDIAYKESETIVKKN